MSGFAVKHLDHVAITVRDLARSRDWYRSVLGLERRFEDQWGDVPTMMCAGVTCVAIFPADDTGPGERANSVDHFAFTVDRRNFELAQERFRELGIDFRFADHGITHSVYITDPDGYRIEITTDEV